MLLLISDANILIDIEVGGLTASMFSLNYQFALPDVLFYDELEEQHAHLLDMGLEVRELSERMVARVSEFARQYRRPSRMDLFALVLAAEEHCPLLTGGQDLRGSPIGCVPTPALPTHIHGCRVCRCAWHRRSANA